VLIKLVFFARSVSQVGAALEGLSRVAQVQLIEASRQGRPLPLLYSSGVRYRRERGTENWLGPVDVLRLGYGDCEDLVAWRVAELREHGTPAQPYCYPPRPGLVHCVVRMPDGSIEDPSKRLGMGGEG
jgi:hypothetical protein